MEKLAEPRDAHHQEELQDEEKLVPGAPGVDLQTLVGRQRHGVNIGGLPLKMILMFGKCRKPFRAVKGRLRPFRARF